MPDPTTKIVPRHIAVIMDGNGRWAAKRGLPRVSGHLKGVESVRDITSYCAEHEGIKQLTLYTWSAENWKRPKTETFKLMQALTRYLQEEIPTLLSKGIRIRVIGNRRRLPGDLREAIRNAEQLSARQRNLLLCLAVDYGSRAEIVRAVRRICRKVADGRLKISDVDEGCVSEHLFTAGMPEPDLLIRTAGEKRLSNYLLWQMWYTEFYFTRVLWPDFRSEHLERAIRDYTRRRRKFGGLVEARP